MKPSLPKFLYYSSNMALWLFALIISYMLLMAFLALFGFLPKYFDASFEVPVHLDNPSSFYVAESLDDRFHTPHIEIQKADLEVRPKNRSWPQSIGYLHAAIYLSFFFFMLFFLSKILKTFKEGHPFSNYNSAYIRKIGFLSIGLGLYEFLLMLFVCAFFQDKFLLSHGHTLDFPSFWDINLIAIFLGFVFLALAEVFNHGRELQELESQTV